MTKDDAVKLLQDRWNSISNSYGTATQFATENKLLDRLSIETITRILLRGKAPGLEMAIDLGAAMGMPLGQLKQIAMCYGNKTIADLMEGDIVPGPEKELAKRIMALAPNKRKLVYDLVETWEV